MRDAFPEEVEQYAPSFAGVSENQEQLWRIYLFNPMNFVGTEEKCNQAKYFRIRVGSRDADTSLTISMSLSLKLQNTGCENVDYAIVWDQPHCDADYPGEFCDWIREICNKPKQ